MNEQLTSLLSAYNDVGKFKDIINLTTAHLAQHPDDLYAKYCLGMAYVAGGDKKTGIQHLQDIISSSFRGVHTEEPVKMFVRRVILQTVEIMEMNMHDGETLGYSTLKMIQDIKRIGQLTGDKPLKQQAEGILNRWWHEKGADSVVALMADSPLTLQIEPTNVCNLNCIMCPRKSMTRKHGFLDVSLFETILATWKNRTAEKTLRHLIFDRDMAIYKKGSIKMFFMGEPLLHPQMDQLIAMGRAAGCSVGIQTNGVALEDEEVRTKILAACPSAIGISLDGIDPTTYESVRQGSRWTNIVSMLEKLSEQRKQSGLDKKVWIAVSSILPNWTEESAQKARDFFEPIKTFVDSIGFIPLSRERDPKFFNIDGTIGDFNNVPRNQPAQHEPLCAEALTKVNILWDGTMVPCCYDIDGTMVYGHVKDGVDTVWNSKKVKEFRGNLIARKITKYPLCKACYGKK